MLDAIDEAHDWDQGQTYGGSGTQMSSTDTCRICGLTREWFSDSQNGVEDRYTFEARGFKIPLRDVAALEC